MQGPTDGVRHSANGSGSDPIRGIALRRFAELDREGRGRVSFLEASGGPGLAGGGAGHAHSCREEPQAALFSGGVQQLPAAGAVRRMRAARRVVAPLHRAPLGAQMGR